MSIDDKVKKIDNGRRMIVLVILIVCAVGYVRHASSSSSSPSSSDAVLKPLLNTAEHPKTAHIFVLLDRTGSMGSIASAVRSGFDEFVATQQRRTDGKMKLTLAQFDTTDPFELVHDGRDIHSVPPLKFFPRDMTPLYDAMGKMIAHVDKSQARAGVEEDVTIVVYTDGSENASREHTRQSVFKLVEERKAKGWTFVFMGANQDSYQTGDGVGIKRGSVSNFYATAASSRAAWHDISEGYSYRRSKLATKAKLDEDDIEGFMDKSSRSSEK